MSEGTPTVVGAGLYDSLARIAAALERIADALDDVTNAGRLNVGGLLVTREDRP